MPKSASGILSVNVHREFFDATARGEKTTEYRSAESEYWRDRIETREFDEIHFRSGYNPDPPFMRVEYLGWSREERNGRPVYALKLGRGRF
jgi:hypothetical protein